MYLRGWTFAGLLIALACPVHADPGDWILPPGELHGTYIGADMLRLEWKAPIVTEAPDAYNVYRTGLLIGSTAETFFEVTMPDEFNEFQVTAVSEGNESLPSLPVIGQRGTSSSAESSSGSPDESGTDGPGSIDVEFNGACPMTSIFLIYTAPFVSVSVYEECIPLAGSMVSPPVDVDLPGMSEA